MAKSLDLYKQYPWLVRKPLIVNAPMAGFAGPELAAAVHEAGSFGFLGAMSDVAAMYTAMDKTCRLVLRRSNLLEGEVLPIGIGVLLCAQAGRDDFDDKFLQLVSQFRPAAVWLFAAYDQADYELWSQRIRAASPASRIWMQISSVAAAIHAVRACTADVLVLQGSDAGGHGKMPGASVISLLPEIHDALAQQGLDRVALLAAGGITDGRGVAAALAAGADGVALGTAFLAAKETVVPDAYRDAVLQTTDGGVNTVRSTIFDELPGKNIWPVGYDGRAIVGQSYHDYLNGTTITDLRRLYQEAKAEETQGYGKDNRRAALWAGTGIGLVRKIRPASDILEEIEIHTAEALRKALAQL